MTAMLATLDDIRKEIAARLKDAADNRRAPMHTPVVASADAELRVMVLRNFDPELWTLRFHTDARAPKCATITEDSKLGVLFYDPAAKTQIRARGQGRIITQGQLVDAAWAASSEYARRCYLAIDAPGARASEATSGLPREVEGIKPDEASLLPARDNFAVLDIALDALDWLYLAHDGHRRARFRRVRPPVSSFRSRRES